MGHHDRIAKEVEIKSKLLGETVARESDGPSACTSRVASRFSTPLALWQLNSTFSRGPKTSF